MIVPVAADRGLALRQMGVLLTVAAAAVRCRVLQVVEARNREVEVSDVAPIGPWRAPVLFHDYGGRVRVASRGILDQKALATASDIIISAVADSWARYGASRVTVGAGHPHFLT